MTDLEGIDNWLIVVHNETYSPDDSNSVTSAFARLVEATNHVQNLLADVRAIEKQFGRLSEQLKVQTAKTKRAEQELVCQTSFNNNLAACIKKLYADNAEKLKEAQNGPTTEGSISTTE